MPQPRPLPTALQGRVFSRSEAAAHDVTDAMIRSSRIVPVFNGLYRYVDTGLSLRDLVVVALRVVPRDAALSHVSALLWRGLDVAPQRPLHFATNLPMRTRRDEIVLHRHRGPLEPTWDGPVRILGPERTFVDCGTMVGLSLLVAIGDWLVAHDHTTVDRLRAFADASHLDGVQRARVAAELVCAGAESIRESLLRVALVVFGLPLPEVNLDIQDARGAFVARGDLVYRLWRIVVEYDGWYHERSAHQRQYDILRRERLEAEGWLVVVVTSADLDHVGRAAWRVFHALRSRGYAGPAPRLDPRFGRWMATNHAPR